MRKIVLASNNKHKIEEFKQLFKNCEVVTMAEVGFVDDIVEDGETFLDNSLIKATAIHNFLKDNNIDASVVADDSGLCINALNGEPGVYSARYSGGHGNSAENRKLVLEKLSDKQDRTAYFCCCLVEMFSNGEYIYGEGKTFGKITKYEIGDTSFGYDCIFLSDDLNKTFGQATSDEKNSVSHRGRAFADLLLKENLM